jgi:UDP-N-acetylmuramoyl-tripeptide--D-alanyl-D-alanine ligase
MATAIPANQARFTVQELAQITGAAIDGVIALDAECLSVCTDTRQLVPGALFVALRGESMDGHSYLAKAKELGAVCAVVASDWPEEKQSIIPCLRVRDTLVALGDIAQAHQRRVRLQRIREGHAPMAVLAVGGAAGKTTTKELAACAARALYDSVLSTRGNLNNLIGVPMTLLLMRVDHRAAVIEVGTNCPGEIPRLGAIVEPTVSLVLNVDAEHTEGLRTLEAVADEEGALFAHAQQVCVANQDEPYSFSRASLRRDAVQLRTFSSRTSATIELQKRVLQPDGTAVLSLLIARDLIEDGVAMRQDVPFSLLGEGPAIDAAAALTAVASMRTERLTQVELNRIFAGFATIKPVAGRLVPRETAAGVLLLDDTYNANPRSVQLSIETGADLARLRGGRLHVILADMLELGELGPGLHAELAPFLLRANCRTITTVGPLMALAARAVVGAMLRGESECVVLECATPMDAARAVQASAQAGDVVLVKGSRGMRTERAIAVFFENLAPQGGT